MIKKLFSALFMLCAGIGLIVVVLAAIGVWSLHKAQPPLPHRMVLTYTFYGTPPDAPTPSVWLSRFVSVEPTLAEVCDALYHAARDPRVESLAVKLGDGDYRWADVQELRAAVAALRAAGKKTYVFSESYGESGAGMGAYYLASAFESLWLQPVGGVGITGFHAEAPYFRKTLDTIGIKPEIVQKGTYKTAPESALLDTMSDAQRETIHGILSSMMTDFFEATAKGRGLAPARVGELVDGAPYTASEAKDRKLVDTIGYEDDLIEKLTAGPNGPHLVDAVDYLYSGEAGGLKKLIRKEEKSFEKNSKKPGVALVYISGMILPGEQYGDDSLIGATTAYAGDIARAIADAADDSETAAIVLRVDSPGGSPAASETIRHAVEAAAKKGKYIVVSMGSEAASGGYWVSVDAARIFAQEGTLTGSIGVFGGKVSLNGLWDRLGVRWDGEEMGENAAMFSTSHPYTEQGRAATQRILDDVYDAFIDRVAKGRHFAPEVVEDMAQGRVWTGRQALERGLIDEIGGLHAALENVARKLGVRGTDGLDVYETPEAPGPLQTLEGFAQGGARLSAFLSPFLQDAAAARRPALGMTRAQSFAFSR